MDTICNPGQDPLENSTPDPVMLLILSCFFPCPRPLVPVLCYIRLAMMLISCWTFAYLLLTSRGNGSGILTERTVYHKV
jgi:hypothetical protein